MVKPYSLFWYVFHVFARERWTGGVGVLVGVGVGLFLLLDGGCICFGKEIKILIVKMMNIRKISSARIVGV